MKNATICSKHDDIVALAGKIASEVGQDISHGEASQIAAWAEEIIDQATKCKDDGERMEAGLVAKRKEISRLESEVEELKAQIKTLEIDVAYYKEQVGTIQ